MSKAGHDRQHLRPRRQGHGHRRQVVRLSDRRPGRRARSHRQPTAITRTAREQEEEISDYDQRNSNHAVRPAARHQPQAQSRRKRYVRPSSRPRTSPPSSATCPTASLTRTISLDSLHAPWSSTASTPSRSACRTPTRSWTVPVIQAAASQIALEQRRDHQANVFEAVETVANAGGVPLRS